MLVMTVVLRWSWVLGIALFLPVALPAGGSETLPLEICCSKYPNVLLISDCCDLKASPAIAAPKLRTLDLGTPLQVLRRWKSDDGKEWLHVQIVSNKTMEFSSFVRRGWLNVRTT